MAPQPSQTSSLSAPAPAPALAPASSFTPSLEPPAGVTPNPDHPASLAGLADITAGICVSVVSIFFLLRLYVRVLVKRVWIFEDVLVTTTWIGTIAYCAIMRATMSHHGGEHGWDMTRAESHEAAYWFNVAAIEYGVMIGMTKLSVLWLYRRVFSPVRWSAFDLAIVSLIVVVIGFYGSTTFVKIFQCSPRDKIWNSSIPGRCVPMRWILNVSGGFNTVTDFLILLLPIHATWKLQMDRLKRVLVVLAFTFGLCAPIFASIGFVVRLENSGNADVTWKQPEILLWGSAELASGLLCVCFPELAVLFRKRLRTQYRNRLHPRRAPTSVVRRWIEADRQGQPPKPLDPYYTKALLSTTFASTHGDAPYIELQDGAAIAPPTPARHPPPEPAKPEDGVVVVRSEVKVERQEHDV